MIGLSVKDFIRFSDKISYLANGCWDWVGCKDADGYGLFKAKSKMHRAHRLSLVLTGKSLDSKLVVDHICRNRSCVNPNHLRQVTSRQNVLENSDSIQANNSKKTHCNNGHPLDGITLNGKFQRWCRVCKATGLKNFLAKNPTYKRDYMRSYGKQK